MSWSFRESELQELEPRERPGYKPRPGYLSDKRTENVVKDLNLTLDTGQFRLIFRRGNLSLRLKVTVDLQGCLPKNHSHARLLCYNHRKLYITVKLVKFRIRRFNFFLDLI